MGIFAIILNNMIQSQEVKHDALPPVFVLFYQKFFTCRRLRKHSPCFIMRHVELYPFIVERT